jgi:hypothetical protein
MTERRDRVELKGSARKSLPGGQDAGPADPNQQIEVTVLLRRGTENGEFPSAAQMGARLPRAKIPHPRRICAFARRRGGRR